MYTCRDGVSLTGVLKYSWASPDGKILSEHVSKARQKLSMETPGLEKLNYVRGRRVKIASRLIAPENLCIGCLPLNLREECWKTGQFGEYLT